MTFKGAQNRRSKAILTVKGAQNRRSRANLTFKSCPKPPVQGELEQQYNKTIKVTRQDKTSANATERQCSKTIKETRQDKTSAHATEQQCNKTINVTKQDKTSANATERSRQLNNHVDGYRREISSIYIYTYILGQAQIQLTSVRPRSLFN